jgi:hypothetical protein
METLLGKVSTKLGRKVKELVTGFNTNDASITTNTTAIAAILAGKTFTERVAAVGSTKDNALALSTTKWIHYVTGADASVGCKLPVGVVDAVHVIINPVNNTLKIYPAAGEKIDSGTADVALVGTALYAYIMIYVSAAVGWNTTKFLVAD